MKPSKAPERFFGDCVHCGGRIYCEPPHGWRHLPSGASACLTRTYATLKDGTCVVSNPTSTNPVSLPDGSDTTRPSGKWPSTTGSTDDR